MSVLRVVIAEDRLTALLEVDPGVLDTLHFENLRSTILERIGDLRILERFILHETIDAVCLLAEEGKLRRPFVDIVAKGVPPRNGQPSRQHFYFSPELRAGTEKEDGSVDFKERSYVQVVEAGAPLIDIYPPTKGEDGIDLYGNPIAAQDGEFLHNIGFDSATVSHTSRDALITYHAKRKGWVSFDKKVLSIQTSLTVKGDIDIETGNIRSVGDVEVVGSVQGGYVVETTGDITIRGNVNSGAILRGVNILIEGVCHGEIHAHNTFTASSAEYTQIVTGNLCIVSRTFKCDIICNSAIIDVVKSCNIHAATLVQIETIEPSPANSTTLIIYPHDFTHRVMSLYRFGLAEIFFETELRKRRKRKMETDFFNARPRATKDDLESAMAQNQPYQALTEEIHAEESRLLKLAEVNMRFLEKKKGHMRLGAVPEGTVISVYGSSYTFTNDIKGVDVLYHLAEKRIMVSSTGNTNV